MKRSRATYRWLLDLPRPYSELAIMQVDNDAAMAHVNKMSDAILGFTNWYTSKEGYAFWSAVAFHYEVIEQFPCWEWMSGFVIWFANKKAPLPAIPAKK